MSKSHSDIISDYSNSQARNKIVFHRDEIADIHTINIGRRISEVIFNFKDLEKIPMRVLNELELSLIASLTKHDQYGNYISIENPGILFEKDLKLDFSRVLDNYSQNNVLFVKWEGEIDSDNIYFLSKEAGIKINLKNLSHIVL